MAGVANTFLATSVFVLLLFYHSSNAFPYPYHASCEIEWNFGLECPPIMNRVMLVMHGWAGPDNCVNGGERCLYTVTSVNGTQIRGYHESPKRHYKDDIKFEFLPKNGTSPGWTRGCIVKVTSVNETEISGYHESPKRHYKDDIKFQFIPKNGTGFLRGCIVKGYSRSQTWYALLDRGTNYCNLHNVIMATDLNRDPAYVEFTAKAICTEYDKADCDKY